MENKVTSWANPTPAGLVALAVACFGFGAVLNKLVEPSCAFLFGCILMAGFFIQIVVAVVDLKGGNIAGGNTFLFFSAYFMLATGAEFLIKATGTPLDARIDGWLFLCLFLALLLWTPAFYKTPALLFAIVVLLDLSLPLIALRDLKILPGDVEILFGHIAGCLLLLTGLVAIYLSAALVVNGTYGKTVFPNPAPLYKEKAAKGNPKGNAGNSKKK